MKHAVVFAHPNVDSFTASVARAYAQAAEALGHEVLVRDLYRMGFDPCLKASEVPGPNGYAAAPDLQAERVQLADIDVFAFVYPFWFNAPPGILKGYVDRVFSMDFGFGPSFGGTSPKLTGRKLISFTSSGAPEQWVRDTGAMTALATLFDRHLAQVCGMTVVDHVHAGGIVPGITAESVADTLAEVQSAVRRHFGPPS